MSRILGAGGSLETETTMLIKKSYKTAASTFAIVLTTGFVMQNGDALASRFATDKPQAQPTQDAPVQTAQNLTNEATPLTDQSGLADRVNSSEENYSAPTIASDQEFSALGVACDVTLKATQKVGAMVMLDLKAPCHGNEMVTIHHQGLQFTSATSEVGHITVSIPAMVAMASFDVELVDGKTVSASVDVPEVSGFDRVALQWTGDSGLSIHALELGATYGERGHVWAKAPQSVAAALQARGGYITALGDINFPAAKHVEIYSFPTGQMQKSGVVRLSVEAEVTAVTCSKEIEAQALQSGVDGAISVTDLTFSMPTCDGVGDFLVLNNLLRDLKIAQN